MYTMHQPIWKQTARINISIIIIGVLLFTGWDMRLG